MLIKNWQEFLLKAWSVRITLLAILLGAMSMAVPYFQHMLPLSQSHFAMLVLALNIAAPIAQLIVQKNLSEDK